MADHVRGREREAHDRRLPRDHGGVAPVQAQFGGLAPDPIGAERPPQGRNQAVAHRPQSGRRHWLEQRVFGGGVARVIR